MGSFPLTGLSCVALPNVAGGGPRHACRASPALASVCWRWFARVSRASENDSYRSLAAILVYTGYKLVNVQNMKRLLRLRWSPYCDLRGDHHWHCRNGHAEGYPAGLALSILKVIYARTHFEIRVQPHANGRRLDVYFDGALTFFEASQVCGCPRGASPIARRISIYAIWTMLTTLAWSTHQLAAAAHPAGFRGRHRMARGDAAV